MEKGTAQQGVTGLELLLVAFVVLKLVGLINWSWWWVLSPVWIPVCIFAVIVLAIVIVWLLGQVYNRYFG